MCGRYALFRWSPAFAALPGFPADQKPHWNLAPGMQVLMLRAGEQGPQAVAVKTGVSNGRQTEILGGDLNAGMAVITDYQDARS